MKLTGGEEEEEEEGETVKFAVASQVANVFKMSWTRM